MSPNVGNFVHDLVEMAKAMETLPQVQFELDHAKLDQHNLSVEIDRLKADLEQSRNYAASLEQKVRTTEAERDDAELRFLELDEKAHKALGSINMLAGYIEAAESILAPPKPQPEPEPVQQPVSEVVQSIEAQPQGQSDMDPTTAQGHVENSSTFVSSPDASGNIPTAGQEAPQPPASQDQDEVNPTMIANSGEGKLEPTSVTSSATEDVTLAKPSGPYTGKRYYDHPVYVSYWEWIEGGGTEADYHWRPIKPQYEGGSL